MPNSDETNPDGWTTLRELDAGSASPKGSAFRAFKRIESQVEGRDFLVLHHEHDRERIDRLRRAGRIYPSTVNLVLLSAPLASAVRAQMRRMTTDPAE